MSSNRVWILCVVLGLVACDKSEKKEGGGAEPAPAEVAAGEKPAPAADEKPAAPAAAPTAPAAAPTEPPAAAPAAPAAAAPAAPAAAAPAAPAEATGYQVGDLVYGKWTDGNWYPGKIGAVNADGTYRVNYNDGDVSKSLSAKKVKPRKASTGKRSGSGGCGADLKNDPKNCGSCGFVCPEACMNGSCVSNSYKYGN